MMGFDGTVQYMSSLGANADAGSDYCGSYGSARRDINHTWLFHPSAGGAVYFSTLGTAVIGHHYWDMTGDAVGPNMINF